MVYRGIFLALTLFLSVGTVYGQKVKYKDLFLLLDSKQFDTAEPFLKKFLKDNPEHANALLYMGTVYHEKSNKEDVLKQTELVAKHIDSAVYFYEKAYKQIDEKEVKKNDEYYESYKRRDMRSGEFIVTLSDVQYDIEKRMTGLKDRKSRVFQLKEQLATAQASYGRSAVLYGNLQSAYPSQRELLLRSDEMVTAALNRVITVFDSSMTAFKAYKNTSALLGKTGYNQTLNLQEIKDFKKDGLSPYDFMLDDLKLWDFKAWAQGCLTTIEKEIIPMREGLVTYDMEINKLGEKVKKDSVSVKAELDQLVLKSPNPVLRKNDPNALPAAIFDMKIAELYYASELVSQKAMKDSVNVSFQLKKVDAELKRITKVDSISASLMKRDITKESENYKHFVVTSYGTAEVLKSLVKATNEYANRERLKKLKEWEYKSQSLKWIVVGKDSIPLFSDETTAQNKFKPLLVMSDDYTVGLHYGDSVAVGYFYTITPSRLPDVKAIFPVDKVNFTRRNLPILKGLGVRDDKGQVYFGAIYSEAKVHDKFSVVIAKIYRSDGLAWSRTYLMDLVPSSLIFDPGSGELSVKTVSPSGDSKIVTLDKNGKQLQ